MRARLGLRAAALGYLALLLVLPLGMVFWRTFQHGLGPVWDAATAPDSLHALWLTVLIALIAVPANTVFGVVCALVIVRGRFQGKTFLNALVDLPFALSPVVVGLSLYLVYARTGWLGGWLLSHGIAVIFALPGMILATIFVSLPFVVREVVPVLREIGTEQEQAAWTLGASKLQTFFRVTLPNIRWGLLYGIALSAARAIGEVGAVLIVSGSLQGQTETATLYILRAFDQYQDQQGYIVALTLAVFSIVLLIGIETFKRMSSREAR